MGFSVGWGGRCCPGGRVALDGSPALLSPGAAAVKKHKLHNQHFPTNGAVDAQRRDVMYSHNQVSHGG